MRRIIVMSLLVLCAFTTAGQTQSKMKYLWNSRNFDGWELITTSHTSIDSVCAIRPDSVLAIAGKPVGYLATTDSYKNYTLHLEYRWQARSSPNP